MNDIAPPYQCLRPALIAASFAVLVACSPASQDAASCASASQESSRVDESMSAMLPMVGALQPSGQVTFIVRFAADHPLGRAQTLQASGRAGEAERVARAAINEDFSLYGLCFQRFTASGAEVVLASCTPPRAGREDRNRQLARQRATAVQRQLVAFGIPQEEIAIGSAGEIVPQSATDDRLNRRVSVVLVASPRTPVALPAAQASAPGPS